MIHTKNKKEIEMFSTSLLIKIFFVTALNKPLNFSCAALLHIRNINHLGAISQ